MRYLPHTPEDMRAMLEAIHPFQPTQPEAGWERLLAAIPEDCRSDGELNLPPALTEWALQDHVTRLSRTMAAASGNMGDYQVYVGAGSYSHFIPAVVGALVSRAEFFTAYTPYQPELSQGTLQTIFEYQTLIARLLGLEVANASMYDGASALAEGLLMALRSARGKKHTVAISRLIHPLYRQVIQTYFAATAWRVVELPGTSEGLTDLSGLADLDGLAAVAVQSPNFMGCIEPLEEISRQAHQQEALCVAGFTEPLAFGLYRSPGQQGADIACGEGQSLGLPQSYGGPGLGLFASRNQYVRNMPGRLVGQTTDRQGRRGFVLTLATREQHIRRDRATSNICSNQALCATAATIYLACLGGHGLRRLARLNYDKAAYLRQRLADAGLQIPFSAPIFNEFVVRMPSSFGDLRQKLLDKKIIAGLPLDTWYPELPHHYLFCVTETHTRAHLDRLVQEVTA